MKVGIEFFAVDDQEWLAIANPKPAWWWLPIWLVNLFGLVDVHVIEAD